MACRTVLPDYIDFVRDSGGEHVLSDWMAHSGTVRFSAGTERHTGTVRHTATNLPML
jgi:hypothetical protein